MSSQKIRTLILFLVGIVVLGSVIWFRQHLSTSAPVTSPSLPTSTIPPPIVQPTPSSRAMVDIISAPDSVRRGDDFHALLHSNEWSSCIVDVYTPNDKPRMFKDPKEAQAHPTAQAQQFAWDWTIPSDATVGTWTIRFICGSFDNFAERDHALEVK